MVRLRQLRLTAVVLPLLFLVLAGTAYARPKLAEKLGLDVWKIRQLEAEVQACQELAYSLDRRCEDMQETVTVNRLILTDLVAGRIDLTEATKRKWEVNGDHDFFRGYLDRTSSAPGYEAKVADDLVRQAGEVCSRDDGPLLTARLRREYETAYGGR